MLQKFFCLLALLTASFLSAQTIPKTDNICFFQDAKTGKPVTIVNDSLVYKGELKTPTKLKHTEYPDVLKNYTYHFNIKNHTYLVHVGCGPVLEYRNDSIVRIDNSFLQKNQLGASPFVYNDQICLFGGYGLFTDKNIITRFDFKPREWFQLFSKGTEKPSARSCAINFFNNDGFYLFGGWSNLSIDKDNWIWFFNYRTLKWKHLYNYNENILNIITQSTEKYNTFQTDTKLYLQNIDTIIEIDFTNNKISCFENKNIISNFKPYFDSNSNSLVYLQTLGGSENLILQIIPFYQLLKHPFKTEKLYYSPWQDYAIPILVLVLSLLLVFGIYKWINNKERKCFTFNQTQNKLYYKSKIINNLDPLEEKILIYLFQNITTFIQLNQLNSFFEKESLDNVANVIKKRDLVLASLFVKLNAYVMHEEKPLVLMQKNEVDKRIKEIKLNPLYFILK